MIRVRLICNITQQYAPGYETEMVFEAAQEEAVQV